MGVFCETIYSIGYIQALERENKRKNKRRYDEREPNIFLAAF